MPDSPSRSFPWTTLRTVVFFVLFLGWVWLRVDVSLIYEAHRSFPPFLTGVGFFRDFLTYPGGLVAYVSALLSQAYCSAWAGALVVTVVAAGMTLATDVVVRAMGGERARVVAFAPAVVMLVAVTMYVGQLSATLGPTLAMACAALYVGLRNRQEVARIGAFLVLSPALYYAAGGPFLMFAVVVVLFELLAGKSRLAALVVVLASATVPHAIGTYLLALPAKETYLQGLPLPGGTERGPWQVVLVLDVLLVLAGPVAALVGRVVTRLERRRCANLGNPPKRRWSAGAGALLLWGIALGAAALAYSPASTAAMRLATAAREGRWEQVLREARRLPLERSDPVVRHHVNRALYETGRLASDMFAYPQGPDSLTIDLDLGRTPEEQGALMQRRNDLFFQLGDLELQLGLVNEVEHEAHEALSVHGPHALVLKQLALVNLVKGQPEAARVFLNALSRDLVERRWAQAMLKALDDGSVERQPLVRQVRAVMLTEDDPRLDTAFEARCLALLKRNPHNRMAFEYLMAYYLMTGQLEPFARNLHRLRDFGYATMPRAYEEAVLAYEADTSKHADRAGFAVSDQTLQEFAGFCQEMAAAARAGDVALAAKPLAARYGNTFFYYHAFGQSGVGER